MIEKAAFVEDLIAACRELGRARIVLRNVLGLSEVFADLEKLELRDGWIHLVQEGAHLHLDVDRLHGVRFHQAAETGESRAISLCGERGCPLLVVVLDQTHGPAALAQTARFERLGEELGPFARLVSGQDLIGRPAGAGTDSDAANRGAERPMAGGSTLWH